MAFNERTLDDYIDVAQRIADFRELHPTGSLQPADPARPWEQAAVTGYDKHGNQFTATMIVYTAAAYRTPDDPRPGIGVAWEAFPGRTPYTLGSELMNAETSAWGRAIVAVLASDSKRGVASREEVAARRAERDDGLPVNADGSLSRSRTSDAEKDAAGVMTKAQQDEHTALGGGNPRTPKAERGKVSRVTAQELADAGHSAAPVPASPWDNQPAGHPEREYQPGSITPRQQRIIMAALTAGGRPARMARIEQIIGHPVPSTNELSYVEAQKVLAAVQQKEPAK
jgi:hypothetical protein